MPRGRPAGVQSVSVVAPLMQVVQALLVLLLVCVSAPVALSQPAGQGAMAATPATSPSSSIAPASQDLTAFFPNLNNDLTQVTWAHAVNNKTYLKTTLADPTILMLEADVVLGKVSANATSLPIPIMGHPPQNESDLSLADFVTTVMKHNEDDKASRRGIKLDFKTIDVFRSSLQVLKGILKNDVPDFPVWLNADILPGPVNSAVTPVDAKNFLDAAKAAYPELTLSLGWTTAWGGKVENQTALVPQAMYSVNNVDAMIQALTASNIDQPVTYAVRAAFVAHSLDELRSLLNQTNGNATLTVWSSDDADLVDVKALRRSILDIGKNRVFLDVGKKLEKDLDLRSSGVTSVASVTTVVVALIAVLLRGL